MSVSSNFSELKTFYQSYKILHGDVYSLQNYVIEFIRDLRQFGDFLRVLWFPPPIKFTATI